MRQLFDLDSPVMRFLSRAADLIILNILVLITIIPIITVGASLSAMHYVLIKMVRNEENYIIKMYFKAFKDNFVQGTLLWLIDLFVIGVFIGDFFVMTRSGTTFPWPLVVAICAICVVALMTSMYIFPLQARFVNSVGQTLKNAFLIMILNLPRSVLMLLVYAIPVLLLFLSTFATPFLIMFGMSLPGLAAAYLYKKVFAKFEPEEEIISDMEFSISEAEGEVDGQGEKSED